MYAHCGVYTYFVLSLLCNQRNDSIEGNSSQVDGSVRIKEIEKMEKSTLHISESDKMKKPADKFNAKLLFDGETTPIGVLSHNIKYVFISFTQMIFRHILKAGKSYTHKHTHIYALHFILIHTDCVRNSKLTENVNSCTANKKYHKVE